MSTDTTFTGRANHAAMYGQHIADAVRDRADGEALRQLFSDMDRALKARPDDATVARMRAHAIKLRDEHRANAMKDTMALLREIAERNVNA